MPKIPIKKLLILGNGSDLYQGYPYTYKDFFNNRYLSYLDSNTHIPRRDIYDFLSEIMKFFKDANTDVFKADTLTVNEDKQSNINSKISNFLTDNESSFNFCTNEFNILDLVFLYPDLITSQTDIKELLNEDNIDWTDIESVIGTCSRLLDLNDSTATEFKQDFFNLNCTLDVINQRNDKIRFINITDIINNHDSSEYSKKQLRNAISKIEERFQEYLLEHSATGTSKYPMLAREERLNTILPTDPDKTVVLNFNYTVFDEHIPTIHPHGSIQNRNIIFGINSTVRDTLIPSNDSSFMLTKTYRGLLNRTIKENINRVSLPKRVDEVVFFGHSLNVSDYDYFYSIFDAYDLYGSNLKLTFYYAFHGNALPEGFEPTDVLREKQKKQIQFEQISPITKLIDQYGESFKTTEHGNNLLHRLLLEGRIQVLNIDKTII